MMMNCELVNCKDPWHTRDGSYSFHTSRTRCPHLGLSAPMSCLGLVHSRLASPGPADTSTTTNGRPNHDSGGVRHEHTSMIIFPPLDDHRVTAIPSPLPSCQQLILQPTLPVDQEDPHRDSTFCPGL